MNYIFGLILFVPGLYVVVNQIKICIRAFQTLKWRQADAVISDNFVRKSVGKWTFYYPQVEYEYSVEGKKISCDRLSYRSIRFNNRQKTSKFLEIYALGSKTIVYYDPNVPHEAVLITGWGSSWDYFDLFAGIWLIAVGISVWLYV